MSSVNMHRREYTSDKFTPEICNGTYAAPKGFEGNYGFYECGDTYNAVYILDGKCVYSCIDSVKQDKCDLSVHPKLVFYDGFGDFLIQDFFPQCEGMSNNINQRDPPAEMITWDTNTEVKIDNGDELFPATVILTVAGNDGLYVSTRIRKTSTTSATTTGSLGSLPTTSSTVTSSASASASASATVTGTESVITDTLESTEFSSDSAASSIGMFNGLFFAMLLFAILFNRFTRY